MPLGLRTRAVPATWPEEAHQVPRFSLCRPGAGQAFITGIMSMMPAALALPIKEIFEQIVLETEVMDALLSHAGTLGRILALLESFDNEDSAGCDTLIGEFSEAGLTRNTLNTALAEALRWINAAENET